ncbi:MAG: hypothetical protein RRA45_00705 [Saccharolobus sp.]|uniref:hypothetical protein n=1 Tax=Saccharolobus sp. TaxID=2100761 RepID=UPI0028CCF724|nr:hypothetical protein [Saccharolobus sp.]MDT7860732.1 hypothetical protein [Saccharolobus sp.]
MRKLHKKLQDYLIDFINIKENETLIVRDDCEILKKLMLILLVLGQKEVEIKNCEELIVKKHL